MTTELIEQIKKDGEAVVLHIGCGMDSRIERTGVKENQWFDIDFESVIIERKKHYRETDYYHMIVGDASKPEWVTALPKNADVIVILEGISMYLKINDIENLLRTINNHFNNVNLLIDCYTELSAKMSKYKNPVNDVGVTQVFGIDNPELVVDSNVLFKKEHEMIPAKCIEELDGLEKFIFRKLYAGNLSKKLYKLYEFEKSLN